MRPQKIKQMTSWQEGDPLTKNEGKDGSQKRNSYLEYT